MSFEIYDDVIDMRGVTDRVEELRDTADDEDDRRELSLLEGLLSELAGRGGDHQWEGSWYPITLIRDSYFRDYAEELAEDIDAINREDTWPNNCIDWERAARELQSDYSSVDLDGNAYWYR